MLGARLVSVQKLLGHSDPKITERRNGHLLPDFMKSEVDRLRFGLDKLAPPLDSGPLRGPTLGANGERDFAGLGSPLGIPLVSASATSKAEAGTLPDTGTIPASPMAGCTGLEPVASGVTGRRYIQIN